MEDKLVLPTSVILQDGRRDRQQATLSTTSVTTIYTPSAKDRPIIESILATHRAGTAFAITLELVTGGVGYFLNYQTAVAANTPFIRTPINLPLMTATDFLRATVSVANVDIVVVAKTTGGNSG